MGYTNHLLHIAFTHKLTHKSARSKDDYASLFMINYCFVVKMPIGCKSYTTAMPVCFFLNGATFVGMMYFWVEQHRGRCGLDSENSRFCYGLLFAVDCRIEVKGKKRHIGILTAWNLFVMLNKSLFTH